jgi:hypothetical protein
MGNFETPFEMAWRTTQLSSDVFNRPNQSEDNKLNRDSNWIPQ